ncbi:MAG TPA: efflux RND transporter periplasmic adaptor subunit [Planctomycetota bacterium]|nr:efflux RND transporter periplasmic adaptor subunit [Planctomycetota bacterium]
MKLPLIIASLVGVGVIAVVLSGAFGGDDAAAAAIPPESMFAVQHGSFTVTLTENGTLVAKDSQKLSTGTESSSKLTLLVEEGKTVAQDEVLAKLDTTELETDQQQITLDIVAAEANLSTSKNELEIQKADNEASIEKSQIALDKAKMDLEKYRDGDAPGERRKLEIAIKDAETTAARSKKKLEDSQLLFKQEYIPKSELEQNEIESEKAEVVLEGARRELDMFEKYKLPMDLTEKEAAVRDAQRERNNADLRTQSLLRQKEVAVEQNDKRLTRLKERLDRNQKEIEKMTVKAPSPGIVLYGDPEQPWNRDNIRLGGEIWGGMVLITLPDLRVMQVKLSVHEADVNKLEAGQKCKVTMDTYPGVVLDGEVTKIASIAGSGNPWDRDPEVKKFDVSVTLADTSSLALKPGISAKAEIFVDRRDDVLYAPLQCVFPREGRSWVWVVGADGQPQAREVTTGTSNDNFVELATGVKEGEHVLLYNPQLPRAAEPGEAPKPQAAAEPQAVAAAPAAQPATP